MKKPFQHVIPSMVAVLLVVFAALTPAKAQYFQQTNPPPFDFNDQYYLQNGINPPNILQRVGTSTNNSLNWTICQSTDPAPCPDTDRNKNQTRVLQTTGGFAFDGSLLYYSIMGFVTPSTFTTDYNGKQAQQIANAHNAFIFPIRQSDGSYILSPALSNRRQDNLFDTSGRYIYEDPLGLWLLQFVELTPFGASAQGQQILAPFAQANGVGTDGTPVVETLNDINSLVQQGVFQLVTRNLNGSQGFPWVIWPIINDPRFGGIAQNQSGKIVFVEDVRRSDGTSVTPAVPDNFNCLQQTGNFCPGTTNGAINGQSQSRSH